MIGNTASGTCQPISCVSVSVSPAMPALATRYGNESCNTSSHVRNTLTASVRPITIATGTVLISAYPAAATASRNEGEPTTEASEGASKINRVAATARMIVLQLNAVCTQLNFLPVGRH